MVQQEQESKSAAGLVVRGGAGAALLLGAAGQQLDDVARLGLRSAGRTSTTIARHVDDAGGSLRLPSVRSARPVPGGLLQEATDAVEFSLSRLPRRTVRPVRPGTVALHLEDDSGRVYVDLAEHVISTALEAATADELPAVRQQE